MFGALKNKNAWTSLLNPQSAKKSALAASSTRRHLRGLTRTSPLAFGTSEAFLSWHAHKRSGVSDIAHCSCSLTQATLMNNHRISHTLPGLLDFIGPDRLLPLYPIRYPCSYHRTLTPSLVSSVTRRCENEVAYRSPIVSSTLPCFRYLQ